MRTLIQIANVLKDLEREVRALAHASSNQAEFPQLTAAEREAREIEESWKNPLPVETGPSGDMVTLTRPLIDA